MGRGSAMAGVAGQVVGGRYELLSLLGEGGMGCVWRARHRTLKSIAAVKLITLDASRSRDDVAARFEREAQAVARLRGPNIVQIFDHGVDDGAPYIAMELLEGESLRARLAAGPAPSLAESGRILRGMARGLARAHRAGVVHRDLKPDNVFLAREDGDDEITVKLLDFGIAKLLPRPADEDPGDDLDGDAPAGAAATRPGAILGTPAYMSPEQARGRDAVDARSDIWSFAVIAFECLLGRRPFTGHAFGELVMQICAEPIPVPSSVGTVPDGFDGWFARATERDPALRFPTIEVCAEALAAVLTPGEAWLAGRSGSARRDVVPIELAPATGATPLQPSSAHAALPGDRASELVLLERVREFWIRGVLERSVRDELRIELSKEERAGAVARSFDVGLERYDESAEPLAAEVTITRFFEQRQRALLVLGDPGAGKTTALLELARDLANRAETHPAAPVPVVFTLSAWSDPRQSIEDFVVAQLRDAYQIPERYGRAWLTGVRLACLFDGLDEVAADRQDACIVALDAFRDAHGLTPIAVTCRREDYAARRHRLKLGGALQLRELDDDQIDGFVAAGGPRLSSLRRALEDDEGLRALARSPLLLGIMSLALAEGEAVAAREEGTQEERRAALFERFVRRMADRKVAPPRSEPAAIVRRLGWLARALRARGETLFRLEHLQPFDLPVVPRLLHLVATRLVAGMLGGLAVSLVYRPAPAEPLVFLGAAFAVPLAAIELFVTARTPTRATRVASAVLVATGLALSVLVLGGFLGPIGRLGQLPLLLTGPIAVAILRRHLRLTAGRDVTSLERVGLRWGRWAAFTVGLVVIPAAATFLYLASSDAEVRLADTATFDGSEARSLGVHGVATFAPDGRILVRRTFGRTGVVVDPSTGATLALGGPARTMALGRSRAVADDGTNEWTASVVALDGSTDAVRLARPAELQEGGRLVTASLGAGERRVVTQTGANALWLHDAVTGALVAKLPAPERFRVAAITRDDRHVAVSGFDERARLYELEHGTEVAVPTGTERAVDVDVHPTEGWRAIATAHGCLLRLAPGSGAAPEALGPCDATATLDRARVVFSGDGARLLLVGGGFGDVRQAEVRDARGELVATLPLAGTAWSSAAPVALDRAGEVGLAGHADGLVVARGIGAKPDVVRLRARYATEVWSAPSYGAALSPDGRFVVVAEPRPAEHYVALSLATLAGLLAALVASLRSAPIAHKTRPNQAMARSVAWSLGMSVVGVALGAAVVAAQSAIVAAPLSVELLAPSAGFAILFGLGFGGLDVLSHVALRVVHAVRGELPLRAATFLDEATRRMLLRRVGGGYVFLHRLLLEHFAGASRTLPSRGAPPEAEAAVRPRPPEA